MTELDPRTSRQRRRAADISWARTPNRSERTSAARKATPWGLDYWIAKTKADGIVRTEDVHKAAQNAHRAYVTEMSSRAVKARQVAAEQRRRSI